ncbi:MAG: glycosyltransferase family 2 protein [Candidatus Omnitrophica bacterium]|nr:glycosyltransferase family 2 protein [Candidatus Omnitrophota bacterium]
MKNLDGKVSVIIPVYNGSACIELTILETLKTFEEFSCRYEIIVVDDGSDDDTFLKLKNLSRKYPQIILVRNKKNFGKGRALKKGFRFCRGDWVVFMDADLSLHPQQISTFFDILRLNEADVVIGSKFHPNSRLNYPLIRRILSLGYYYFTKILFGLPVRDTQTGLKLFKYEVLEKVFPKILVKRFAFDVKVLVNAHRLGYKIVEAPVRLEQHWASSVGLSSILNIFLDTLTIFFRTYILRYYNRE